MKDIIQKILDIAVYAPSGDNSQPWEFIVKNNEIKIFNIPDKDNPYLNFQQSGSYVAHGALIENIVIAASQYGYAAEINLFPNPQEPDLVAVIKLEKTSPREELFYPFIKERCTNRKPYENRKLSEGQKRSFMHAPEEVGEGGKVILVDEEDKMKIIGEASSAMEQIALETKFLHKLFFADIVWTEKEEQEKKCGLYLKTMELPPPVQILFKVLKYWPAMNILNKIGFAKMAAKGNAKLYASGGAFGIVVTDGDSAKDFINAGRLTQRVWLKTTKMRLGLHPVTGILFLARRVIAGEAKELSEEHIQLIKKSYETIKSAFGVENGVIAMAFRIGYADKPSAKCSRKPPEIVFE